MTEDKDVYHINGPFRTLCGLDSPPSIASGLHFLRHSFGIAESAGLSLAVCAKCAAVYDKPLPSNCTIESRKEAAT